MADWYTEDSMDSSSIFHMRESYVLKSQSHNPHTPIYMEALSGEHAKKILQGYG